MTLRADPTTKLLSDIGRLVGADRVALYDDLEQGFAERRVDWVSPGGPERAEARRPVLEQHLRGESVTVTERVAGVGTRVTVPTMSAQACRGFVSFEWTQGPHECTPLELETLGVFAASLDGLWQRAQLEAALARTRAQHQALLQHLGVGVVVHGPDTTIISSNPMATRLLGLSEAQLQGKAARDPAWTFVRDDGRPMPLADFPVNQVITTQRPVLGVVVGIRHSEGSELVWVICNAYPVRGPTGDLQQVVVTFADITHHRQSEARLQAISRSFQDGMFYQVIRPKEGGRRFTYLSSSVTSLYGVTPEEGYAHPERLYRQVHPDDAGEFGRKEEAAAAAMQPLREEVRLFNPDGTVRWSTFVSMPVAQPDGSILWDGVEFVVTGRKLAEEALRLNEERLRLALEATSDAFWDWDVRKEQVYCSPRWYSMLGRPVVEAPISMAFVTDLIHPDDAARVAAAWKNAMTRGHHYQLEARMRCADGSWRWVQSRGNVSERDAAGRAVRVSGVNADVHERRSAEEEKARLQAELAHAQKMESVGRLAGGVAHDFNNMLSVIRWGTEAALEQLAPGDAARADLEEVRVAATRSIDLTRQLLAFARKQTVKPQVLDLNQAVSSMHKMLERLIGEDVDFQWQPGAGLWPVTMDPAQLDQVLANLCVNARDAITGNGRIIIATRNVTIDGREAQRIPGMVPGDYATLSVGDDGSGMDEATLAHLFEPFFTTKALGKGTGLGLATSYGVVTQNHGFIGVQSTPGRGTTFTVYLPRKALAAAPGLPVGRQVVTARASATVLLVEDEPALLRITQRMLADRGYTVIAAGRPTEALALSKQFAGPIQVLVSDVVMPEMNGKQLADQLVAQRPELRCLFISGYTADVIAPHGVLDANTHFLQKPFDASELVGKVQELLDARR